MRNGFSTGSCAAAAAKAAAWMLFSGIKKEETAIITPAGVEYSAKLLDIRMSEEKVSCAVKKDAGDDPDITDGALIYAQVSFEQGDEIVLDGGYGVGRITKPGLSVPVGMAAINPVPRKMILSEVEGIRALFDEGCGLKVVIYVPEGRKLAQKTFNPRLGIEGGISILGTKGIVEPMSTQAVIDTIRTQYNVRKAAGKRKAALVFGHYGTCFLEKSFGIGKEAVILCSNYIGQALDIALETGFEEILICGHCGKLVKLAGGIMNTHSKEADCRMELIAASCIRTGGNAELAFAILEQNTTDAAFELVDNDILKKKMAKDLIERIAFHVKRRTGDSIRTECILYTNDKGILGETPGAVTLAKELADE